MIGKDRNDYYQILEVQRSAPQHEITKAYERARLTFSGDNNAIYTIFTESEARELMKMIDEAYAVLGNKTLRSIYDQRLSGVSKPQDLSYESLMSASRHALPDTKPQPKLDFVRDEGMEKELQTREDWSGEFLKKVREYRLITLESLHEKTKINAYYINAIEKMDATNLPAAVFVRGYVVQIAKALGLNEKKVADSYMKLFLKM